MTADLAISGGPTHAIHSLSSNTTLYRPTQYVARWMLTFHIDIVYITTAKMYYRDDSKYSFPFV